MNSPTSLQISLNGVPVGTMVRLADDRNYFSFDPSYVARSDRPTLSLSFKDQSGELMTRPQSTQTRLPPFFSNLLPEGRLRDYLAEKAGVHSEREFFLLWMLGDDLPGAVKIDPPWEDHFAATFFRATTTVSTESLLRFSLAGVQLKFSAVREAHGGLTIPARGTGGDWIVKLPDAHYSGVPENEYAMMQLAREVGIDVPDIDLVHMDQIAGIPFEAQHLGSHAFAIKRFDRVEGSAVHMEDFAQVFGVYPKQKYEKASFENLARVISIEVGQDGVLAYVRRLVFSMLIGNGDMHLKNWSLLYPDGRQAALAPAYDYVSTIPYIPKDKLALNLGSSKHFRDMDMPRFHRLADRAMVARAMIEDEVRDTVSRFADVWRSRGEELAGPHLKSVIDAHLRTIPLWRALAT
ncbi:MAG: type II toxin-antitoxin system HipA family toxin [Acidobacteria bacterium]|nr:type II toxin-antitoxin system HipA family toxin [Acidobacteriota bacterium]